MGHDIRYVFADKENQLLFFTLHDVRNRVNTNTCFLNIFYLKTMKITNEILLSDREGMVLDAFYDKNNNLIYFFMTIKAAPLSYNITADKLESITMDKFNELNEEINSNSLTYFSQGNKKTLFFIDSPANYTLSANYKPKYIGVYLNENSFNIRISKTTDLFTYPSKVYWFEDGRKVIWGQYLFDTSGKQNENKIADGMIMAIY